MSDIPNILLACRQTYDEGRVNLYGLVTIYFKELALLQMAEFDHWMHVPPVPMHLPKVVTKQIKHIAIHDCHIGRMNSIDAWLPKLETVRILFGEEVFHYGGVIIPEQSGLSFSNWFQINLSSRFDGLPDTITTNIMESITKRYHADIAINLRDTLDAGCQSGSYSIHVEVDYSKAWNDYVYRRNHYVNTFNETLIVARRMDLPTAQIASRLPLLLDRQANMFAERHS